MWHEFRSPAPEWLIFGCLGCAGPVVYTVTEGAPGGVIDRRACCAPYGTANWHEGRICTKELEMGRLLITAALVLSLSATARAEIINGDFETGDLTGWISETNGPTITVQDFGGDYKAVLNFDDSSSGGGNQAQFYQEFVVEGTKQMLFSFDYQLSIHDLSGPGTFVDYFMGAGGAANVAGSLKLSDESLNLGPATFSAVLEPGKNLAFFQIAVNVAAANGQMIIDNVQLTPIPEPSSAALVSIGGALVAIAIQQRRRNRNRSS